MTDGSKSEEEGVSNREEAAAEHGSSALGVLRRGVEFIGRHPLATGLLAILGVAGFLLSLVQFQLDRQGASQSSAQLSDTMRRVDDVGSDVDAVAEAVQAPCAGPPCWSLADLVQWETIGRPKDLLDSKLPPPIRRTNGQSIYDFDGCRVAIEYTDEAVSYFSAALYRRVQSQARPCPFDIGALLGGDGAAPRDNAAVRVSDILRYIRSANLYISSACLTCGNYSEPYLEFFQPGPHSADFVDLYVRTDFNPTNDDYDRGMEITSAFNDRLRAHLGDPDEYGIEVQNLCGRDISSDVRELLPEARVTEIGLGRGERVWKNALFC